MKTRYFKTENQHKPWVIEYYQNDEWINYMDVCCQDKAKRIAKELSKFDGMEEWKIVDSHANYYSYGVELKK